MDGKSNQAFASDFRRFFLRGLGALVPTLLTFAVLVWVYQLVNDNVGQPITRGLMQICSWVSARPTPGAVNLDRDPLIYGTPINEWNEYGERLTIEYKAIWHKALSHPDAKARIHAEEMKDQAMWEIAFKKYRLHLIGFLIGIILVYFTGFFLASFIGRACWRAGESLLYRIPLIRAIYPHIKQVTDFLITDKPVEFSGVVAVEYPRRGLWSLGLSTGPPIKRIQNKIEEELVTVFIPSSPTPITGYVITIPKRDTIDMNMTIDEALRYTISGGVIKPHVWSDSTERKSDKQIPEA